jgi:hypothetical protein
MTRLIKTITTFSSINLFSLLFFTSGILIILNLNFQSVLAQGTNNPCLQTSSTNSTQVDNQTCIQQQPCPTLNKPGQASTGCPQPSNQSIQSSFQHQSLLQSKQQTNHNSSISIQTDSTLPKSVNNTHMDDISGISITFPSGWNTKEIIDSDKVKTISASKQPLPSLSKNFWQFIPPYIFLEISPKNLMLNSDKQLHYKNIINYNKTESTKLCKLLSSNKITIDLVPAKEITYSCPFPFNPSVKELVRAIAIEKGQTNIAIEYIAVSESNYAKYLPDFKNSIQSIHFSH